MDKLGEMVEGSIEGAAAYGNPWYVEDDGYYEEEVRVKVVQMVYRLKEDGGLAKRTESTVENEVNKF